MSEIKEYWQCIRCDQIVETHEDCECGEGFAEYIQVKKCDTCQEFEEMSNMIEGECPNCWHKLEFDSIDWKSTQKLLNKQQR